ncbi:DUF4157 domain-containing protein [Trichocoleus sp. DQ-A3]|uniref:eCIS core domain-containing protein n=1 Tax=Cyanophyceae TaxID=3028117 RepID=UPI001688E1F6|nr:DUF4157 domain-containing protein [Coleofasciculus sp. FACHB-125]MBD1903816.1 DUF4157 domain-containing protein [Coleofasciculus sp. FACHB-125]
MASEDQICKNITTLGERLQNIATSLIQQRQPQRLRSQFLKNNRENLTRLSEKWQDIDLSNVQQEQQKPRLLQFAKNIQKKYLFQPANFNAEQLPLLANLPRLNQEEFTSELNFKEDSDPSSGQLIKDSHREEIAVMINTESKDKQVEAKNKSHNQSSINTTKKKLTGINKLFQFAQDIQFKYSLIRPKLNTAVPTLENATPQPPNFFQQKKLDSSEFLENSQARTHSEQGQLEEKIERSSYSPINTPLSNFLNKILNIRIPNVKVYANAVADTFAKSFNADAITYDDKILFRTGKYNPQNPDSIALLGHELTHIVYSQNPNNRQIASNDIEEKSALNNEKQILSYFSFPEVQRNYQQPSIPQARNSYAPMSASHQTVVNAPKTAGESRDVSLPPQTNSDFELTEKHLKKIFEYIEPKINNKIINTWERGG